MQFPSDKSAISRLNSCKFKWNSLNSLLLPIKPWMIAFQRAMKSYQNFSALSAIRMPKKQSFSKTSVKIIKNS
jgi:hypothetical protein